MERDGEGVPEQPVRPQDQLDAYLRVDSEQLTVLADLVANNAEVVLRTVVERLREEAYSDTPGWLELERDGSVVVRPTWWLWQLLEELLAGGDMGLLLLPDADPEVPDYVVGIRPRPTGTGG